MLRKIQPSVLLLAALCLPVVYLALLDVAVWTAVATNTLEHKQVATSYKTHHVLSQGDDEGRLACTVQVDGLGGLFAKTYPVPCAGGEGGSIAEVGVVPGLLGAEVVTLNGTRIWHGEPSENMNFLNVILYTSSYLALLYVMCYGLLRRWPAMRLQPGRLKGLPLAPTFIGGGAGYIGVLACDLFAIDTMAGMLFGALVAAAICLRLGRREPMPAAS